MISCIILCPSRWAHIITSESLRQCSVCPPMVSLNVISLQRCNNYLASKVVVVVDRAIALADLAGVVLDGRIL